jgi:endoglucanase
MLRAAWEDDKPTFDKTWNWTQANLKHQDNNLFSWLYGKRSDGTTGILSDEGGQNSAADADSDIALALVFASKRWQEPAYMDQAKKIIADIWGQEVVSINGQPYLVSNNLEKTSRNQFAVLNPSYFAPYSYRIFAQLDPEHDWNKVIDTSYSVLQQSVSLRLDKPSSAGLPPDWVAIDKTTGVLYAPSSTTQTLTTNYSYDALRTPWRLALDWQWYKEPRAKASLDNFSELNNSWQKDQVLYTAYTHDGQRLSSLETPAMYGGSIGYFITAQPQEAKNIYQQKLITLYNPDSQSWNKEMSYYDDNWSWFGLALYNNTLTNLYQLPSTTADSSH